MSGNMKESTVLIDTQCKVLLHINSGLITTQPTSIIHNMGIDQVRYKAL